MYCHHYCISCLQVMHDAHLPPADAQPAPAVQVGHLSGQVKVSCDGAVWVLLVLINLKHFCESKSWKRRTCLKIIVLKAWQGLLFPMILHVLDLLSPGFQAPSPLQHMLWWGLAGLGLCSRQVLLEPTLHGSELRDSCTQRPKTGDLLRWTFSW